MTKIIAIPLFAALVFAARLDADQPSTGATLGAKTPNIAEKHPDLHRALTDGTFDAMPFAEQIMFLHEPYFRDLAEFGLDAVAVDNERAFTAEIAGKLANAVEMGASVFTVDDFRKPIIEMHAAMFVANDRTYALADLAASPQDAIRERRHVMGLQRRMLDDYVRTMEFAQDASERFDADQEDVVSSLPTEAQTPPVEAAAQSEDEASVQERFKEHQKRTAWTRAKVARRMARRLINDAAFTQEDRALLKSIEDLDTDAFRRRAVEPTMQQLCALPANDVHGRARLMNEASQAEDAALDAATDALLGRLTADGSSRVEALVESDIKNRSSVAIDWEGIGADLPQVLVVITEGACDRYDLMVGIEAVLDKGRVDSL